MEINTLFSNKFMREEIKGEIKKSILGQMKMKTQMREEVKGKIKKYLESNESGNTTYQDLGMQKKQFQEVSS